MTQEYEICQFCKHNHWEYIDTLLSGIWIKANIELSRHELYFPIGECSYCGHVQVMSKYDESTIKLLYFSDIQKYPMFFVPNEKEISAYSQAIDFFKDYIYESSNIVDFGCGSGTILNTLKVKKIKTGTLTGVDFHPTIDDVSINTLAWDLNSTKDMPKRYWTNGIDLALSTHVLEHVIDPISYLDTLAKQLTKDGKIFIEVPDCSTNTDLSHLAFSNVVHGQHIHYFTKESLVAIGKAVGLEVIKIEQIMTRMIPRILIVFKKSPIDFTIKKISDRGTLAVKNHLSQVRALYSKLACLINSIIDKEGRAGLWGVGGDCFALLESYPKVKALVIEGKLQLFDAELDKHTYLGKEIHSSTKIDNSKITLFISPLYAPTREKMILVSKDWNATIIDPYL